MRRESSLSPKLSPESGIAQLAWSGPACCLDDDAGQRVSPRLDDAPGGRPGHERRGHRAFAGAGAGGSRRGRRNHPRVPELSWPEAGGRTRRWSPGRHSQAPSLICRCLLSTGHGSAGGVTLVWGDRLGLSPLGALRAGRVAAALVMNPRDACCHRSRLLTPRRRINREFLSKCRSVASSLPLTAVGDAGSVWTQRLGVR